MPYKTILLHLDESPRCQARRDAAIELAMTMEAHLVGVAVVPPLEIPGTTHPEIVVRILAEQHREAQERFRALGHEFAAQAQRAGLASVESRMLEGDSGESVALSARYADLVMIGQPGGERGGTPAFAEAVVLTAGRPVIILPEASACTTIGTRAMVAWNASREATRALTDAIPLLRRAQRVHVVTVNATPAAQGHGEVPGTDIALYLSRHGVKAEVDETYAEDADIGEWLLSRAADLDVDLMVMGAYGHSRLREMVLGGATRTMLESMTVPVLMSH